MSERQLIGMTERIAALPRDSRGFPIPKFVRWFDGEPDFRVMDNHHLVACINHGKCWICGEQLGAYKAFTIGPMCCINRVSAEPPSHYECALFAVYNCPFLSRPLAKRGDLSDIKEPTSTAGYMIERNPGVACIWITRSFKWFREGTGVLFKLGDPERCEFFAKGRRAYLHEIDDSVRTGLPILEKAAQSEGPVAMKEFERSRLRFEREIMARFV